MIIKRFVRKRSIKIYFLTFIIMFMVLVSLNIAIEYLKELNDKYYIETSLLYIDSDGDYLNNITNDKYIKNIKRCLIFDYNEYENDLKLYKSFLTIYDLDEKVLVYSAKDRDVKLNNNEIILGFDEATYKNVTINDYQLKYKNIYFEYNNDIIEFKIKDIINSKRRSEITISDDMFLSLLNESNNYVYVSNIISEKKEKQIIDKYRNIVNGNAIFLSDNSESDSMIRNTIQNLMNYLKIACYVFIGVFCLITLIINGNIIADLEQDIILEHRLGFKRKTIKINVFKRLLLLHLVSFVVAYIVIVLLTPVINNMFDLSLNIISIESILVLLGLVVISDLLLSIIINKLKLERRR